MSLKEAREGKRKGHFNFQSFQKKEKEKDPLPPRSFDYQTERTSSVPALFKRCALPFQLQFRRPALASQVPLPVWPFFLEMVEKGLLAMVTDDFEGGRSVVSPGNCFESRKLFLCSIQCVNCLEVLYEKMMSNWGVGLLQGKPRVNEGDKRGNLDSVLVYVVVIVLMLRLY